MTGNRSLACITSVELALATVELLRCRLRGEDDSEWADDDLEPFSDAELAHIAANRLSLVALVLEGR